MLILPADFPLPYTHTHTHTHFKVWQVLCVGKLAECMSVPECVLSKITQIHHVVLVLL